MTLPPYPTYKPSGVGWLDDVPEHWEVKRGRFCINVNPRSSRLRSLQPNDEVSFVPMEAVGEYGGLQLEQTRAVGDAGDGYTEFDDGDVVVAKITPCFENGKGALAAGLLNGAAFGTTELHVLRSAESLERRFLFYFTITQLFRSFGEGEMYGAGGQKRIPPEFCENVRILLPPKDDQHAIADFLDRETAKIDTLVAKKRTLVERLKEKRTALITRTVTHGLLPDAARQAGLEPYPKLKPSGIDGIGDVPQDWKIVRIGREITLQRGVDITKDEQQEGEVPVVSSGGISSFHDLALTAAPGVVVGRKGTAGAVHYIAVDFWPHDTTLYVKDFCGNHPRYVYFKLTSMELASFDTGSANPTVNRNLVHPVVVSWPPVPEQCAIADFLDRESAKLDLLTAKIETAIDRLQEYRTALITAAATGKIDVRGAVAHQEDAA